MGVISDPIADMLTRIRNGIMAGHSSVKLPTSKMKLEIASILQNEGYIHGFEEIEEEAVQGKINVSLKFIGRGESAINGLKRVSKPGKRVYAGFKSLPKVRNGLGVAIISTSQGIMTDKDARSSKVGGEVLCFIW